MAANMILKQNYEFVKAEPYRLRQLPYYHDPRNQLLQFMGDVSRESQRAYPMLRPPRSGSVRDYDETTTPPQRRRIAVAVSLRLTRCFISRY
jgi:hypothetical protein